MDVDNRYVGIISDTHDNLDAVRKAVKLLNSKGVPLVIHAGDFIAPFVVNELRKLDGNLYATYGNCDGERTGLKMKLSELNSKIEDFVEFEYWGKKIAVYHGTIEPFFDSLVKSDNYDVVVRGHSHKADIKKVGKTMVINPGEVCGYLTGKRTLCILDIAKMKAEIFEF